MEITEMKGDLGFGIGENKSRSPEAAAVRRQYSSALQLHVFRASAVKAPRDINPRR